MAGTSQLFKNQTSLWSGTADSACVALHFGKQTTTQNETYTVAPAGVGDVPLGIFTAKCASGEPVAIATDGEGMLICNGASDNIAAGDGLVPGTSTGIGIKANGNEPFYAIALEPCIADGDAIRVLIFRGIGSTFAAATATGTSVTLTKVQISGKSYFLNCTSTSAIALAIPAAATVANGTRLTVKHSGTGTNAITITPGAGTIAGGATDTTLASANAKGTWAALGTDWVLVG